MEYLVSAEEMRRADRSVIQDYGVPSLVLMERAALSCVELMKKESFDLSRILVAAGSGNNGGDGFAMARILKLQGFSADIGILQPFFQVFCCSLTEDSDDRRMKLSGLLFQKLHISVGRKCFHLYVTIMFHNFQCLGSDGTGRA